MRYDSSKFSTSSKSCSLVLRLLLLLLLLLEELPSPARTRPPYDMPCGTAAAAAAAARMVAAHTAAAGKTGTGEVQEAKSQPPFLCFYDP
jgi:hypothetical protein